MRFANIFLIITFCLGTSVLAGSLQILRLVNLKYSFKAFKNYRFKEDNAPLEKLDGEFDQPFLSAEKITIEQQIWPKDMKEKFSRRSKLGAPECKNMG